ncbi:MAG TPA: PLP-dependent aminotransferase family protein [Blastocatellia bacterium]|nr:PLP-dependent aminotransferase family protein [Blastocatellia bacterium]
MDFAINLHSNNGSPLHRQLYDELRKAILTGRLITGERLPSTREMAQILGVSRSTVSHGYEQLLSEGYLETAIGSGTFVCRQLPDDLAKPASVKTSLSQNASAPKVVFSELGNFLTEHDLFEPPEPDLLINFRYGRPSFNDFPWEQWRRLLARYCRSGQNEILDYAPNPLGHLALREAIVKYLARSRAVRCDASQVIIVYGSQQALDLISRILVNRGDTVAMEDPGYLGTRRALEGQGAKVLPVPVDEFGLRTDYLARQKTLKCKFVYITPSHEFPMGVALSLPRRLELLAWAQTNSTMIVEDDYDSEFRYAGRPVPALQGLDQTGSVIYVGTFSKVLYPSLRLGYLVVPPHLTNIFAQAKWLADRHSPLLEQYALADFINEGHLERHIRRMRTIYNRRRNKLVEALTNHFDNRVEIVGENAGMHLVARLKTRFRDEEIVKRSAEASVRVFSTSIYYAGAAPKGEFIFGFANLSERKIQDGIRRLAKALD